MASASEWTEIAEACEHAKGPDEDLDWRIALALGVVRLAAREGAPAYAHALLRAQEIVEAPAYTASLDVITDAIGAHLPRCGYLLDSESSGRKPNAYIEQSDDHWTYEGWPRVAASTPPLALCAAFARAMATTARADPQSRARSAYEKARSNG